MASSQVSKTFFMCLALGLLLCVPGALGGITCESLDKSTCAFAVSSSGKRCVLETCIRRRGQEEYTCRTSGIEAEGFKDWIETDECIEACGLDRNSLGLSSDSLLEDRFTQKLCSSQCYQSCTNIVDLYFNIAAGEGVFLPKLCEVKQTKARREMAEIRSSGEVVLAAGPESVVSGKFLASAPSILGAYLPWLFRGTVSSLVVFYTNYLHHLFVIAK